MQSRHYMQLRALACRHLRGPEGADDVVQEALLAALAAGRADLDQAETIRWLRGVVRNQARMLMRGAHRRRRRERAWFDRTWLDRQVDAPADAGPGDVATFLAGLPPALRAVAALALSGHTRREIAFLLHLPDTALRQRLSALRRRMVAAGLAMPDDLPGLGLDLAYGRIRDALLPLLLRQAGRIASHDPDGHLFVIRHSQSDQRRQQSVPAFKENPA